MILTFVAWGPFPDSPSSYSTRAPSARVRNPSPEIPEKWTNASFPPSSGVMTPKPFSSLNHLTTPVAIQHLLTTGSMREGVLPGTAFPHASTASRRTQRCRYTSDGAPCESAGAVGGRGAAVLARIRRRRRVRRGLGRGLVLVRIEALLAAPGGRLPVARVRLAGRLVGVLVGVRVVGAGGVRGARCRRHRRDVRVARPGQRPARARVL